MQPILPSTRLASGERRRVPSVLIVDDEPLDAVALAGALSDACAVTFLAQSVVALERFARGVRYDVVFCNVKMPALNGLALHGRVWSLAPKSADRFVFITDPVCDPHLRAHLFALPNLVLEKPLDMEAVRALVHRRIAEPDLGSADGTPSGDVRALREGRRAKRG